MENHHYHNEPNGVIRHDNELGPNPQPPPQHIHESSGETTPPDHPETPSHGPVTNRILEPYAFFNNVHYQPTVFYTHNGQLPHPGLAGSTFGFDNLDDDMKRSLDISSLPNNPHNGVQPQIDPASSFENVPPKRARHSPAGLVTNTPIAGPAGIRSFTPRGPSHFPNGSAFMSHPQQPPQGPGPQSPLHLGGPLATPSQPTANGHHNHNLNIPQSPFMPMNMNMMNMNGFGMPNFPFMGYPASPVIPRTMNPNNMTGNYGPAAAAAAAAAVAAGNQTGRTVYVGSLPSEASVDELLNLVRFGPIENVRLLPDKQCVFISFLDGPTAAGFHADASVKKLALHGQELRIGWGKASSIPDSIALAVNQDQATRNVFVGNLDETINEQDLRDVCQKFGPIDQVKIVRDKNIGFIHFLSISTAMKVVASLPHEPGWAGRRVNYGKDRCAYVPRAQQAAVQAAQAQAAHAMASQHAQMPGSPFAGFSPMTPAFGHFGTPGSAFGSPMMVGNGFPMNDPHDPASQAGNRTIYVGNIHPDTTSEELCNNIRGGILDQIRLLHDKHIAFVTFVDPNCALAFYNHANQIGLTVNSRRLKIGWGKHSGALSPALLQAVQSGASRNVYIGQITDFELFTEAKLKQDFAEYGEIEMINFLKEKGAAFVNFTSIASAQKAIERIKEVPEYANLRISYGKDRCANQPRTSNTPGSARPQGHRTVSHTSIRDDDVQREIEAIERANPEVPFPDNGFIPVQAETEESFE